MPDGYSHSDFDAPSQIPNPASPLPKLECMLEWFLGTAVSILLPWQIPRFLLQLH